MPTLQKTEDCYRVIDYRCGKCNGPMDFILDKKGAIINRLKCKWCGVESDVPKGST